MFDFSTPVLRVSDHKYVKPNTDYISVSHLLSHFKQGFDPQAYSERMFSKENSKRTPEYRNKSLVEIREIRDKLTQDACDRGTLFHSMIEDRIRAGEPSVGTTLVDTAYRWFLSLEPISVRLEYCLDNPELEIAGTCDAMFFTADGKVNIIDWKTSATLCSYYERAYPQYMKHCFSHKLSCNLNTYELQLNIYARMLEMRGHTIGNLYIFHAESWRENLAGEPDLNYEVKQFNYTQRDAIQAFAWFEEATDVGIITRHEKPQ